MFKYRCKGINNNKEEETAFYILNNVTHHSIFNAF